MASGSDTRICSAALRRRTSFYYLLLTATAASWSSCLHEDEDAAVEEADADADDEVVSVVELELVDDVEDSVMVTSEEPDVLAVMVTSTSMLPLEMPASVVFESAEPTAALESALPAYVLPAAVLAELLETTSIKVSSVSAVLEALAALLLLLVRRVVVSSVFPKLLPVLEPDLELTALVDAETTVDVVLGTTSCAHTALMARAQAMVARRTCMGAQVFWRIEVLAELDCRVLGGSQVGEWRHESGAGAASSSRGA
ncbi:hypothetical protein PF008_g12580 [Phytophthora fragariae]|uniref:Uncharacterized protein n=1 Tax=Phytophthora fragariae TaxID=53985 RepID=A0A6G0RMK6_9STRA|nr:hypothetical protein PF008_g12580 [Phytophthora fragariae]